MSDPTPPNVPSHSALVDAGWRPVALPGYFSLIGPAFSRKEEDGLAYALPVGALHMNPAGVLHGGVVTSLIDQVLSMVASRATDGAPCFTLQLDVNFLAAVRQGQTLEARGQVMRASSSLVFTRGTAWVGSGLVATASALFKAVQMRERVHRHVRATGPL